MSKARRFDRDTNKFVDIKNLMNIKVPIKQGNEIAIIYYNFCYHCNKRDKWKTVAVLTEKFKGNLQLKMY